MSIRGADVLVFADKEGGTSTGTVSLKTGRFSLKNVNSFIYSFYLFQFSETGYLNFFY